MALPPYRQLLLQPLEPLVKRVGASIPPVEVPAGGAVAWLAALLAANRSAPVVLVTAKTARAEALYRELLFFTAHLTRPLALLPFPAWETLPFEPLSPFGPLVGERIATLFRLAQMQGAGPILAGDDTGHTRGVVITTPMALMQRLPPAELLRQHGFSLAQGDQLDLPAFRTFLDTAGYRAVAQVEEPGEFAVRGGIIDLFPPDQQEPVRLELFGDEVETIRRFDPITQRSTDPMPRIQALPVSEVLLTPESIRTFRTAYRSTFGGAAAQDALYRAISQGEKHQGMEQYLPLFYPQTDTLFDYLPQDAVFLLERDVREAAAERQEEVTQRHGLTSGGKESRVLAPERFYLDLAELDGQLARHPALLFTPEEVPNGVAMGFGRVAPFRAPEEGKEAAATRKGTPTVMDQVARRLEDATRTGGRVCLAVRTVGQRERLRELLSDHRIATHDAETFMEVVNGPPGSVRLVVGDVAQGFVHHALGLSLITEEEIFGARVRRRQFDRRYLDQIIASFADLNEGNLVVHADYGIGRYGGLHSLAVGAHKNDFLLVTYAGDDKLYVPVENLDRVSKYSGGEEAPLDKLGAPKWEKTKQKARRQIMEMAEELIGIQARRAARTGFAFSPPDPLYQEFAATFPFEETEDQERAIQAVLEDMASPRPMDRLVCGDVGFGKTEVALRATFRAVSEGKQVAVLVPTTILAQQHYDNFTRRLASYPVRVAQVSRFLSPKAQREALAAVKSGQVDVVVGTHRLLQADVAFKDLGLLVVDEEQRFGVRHKEKIKAMRASVDILTLTATPIPRTLHMAMAGARDISIIATPPADRLAIRTIVTQYHPQQVREAILRELYRGGQVFYLYNHVQDIEQTAAKLMDLVPEARVGVAHGQMREGQLERVMHAFYRQEFNVLVCTTIIENGVDIPSANTIIIHRADKFGLSQLHQLRGRVGRSKHRAYAYFLIPHPSRLSQDAEKRLSALESLGDLGSGFMLATHDLEIRGAGNILGEDQSGQIREVGFELYNQMLQEALTTLQRTGQLPREEIQKAAAEEEIVPQISLSLSSYIPEEYVPDVHQRLSLYKRIADLRDEEEIGEMRVELADRFGPLPETVASLLQVVGIKLLCRTMRVLKLEAGPKGAKVQFHPQPRIKLPVLFEMIRTGRGRVTFNQQDNTMKLREQPWEDPATRLKSLGAALAALEG